MDDKDQSGAASKKADDTPAPPLTPLAPPDPPHAGPLGSSFHPDVPTHAGIPGGAPTAAGRQRAETIEPNRLIIGHDVKLKGGEISACDRLTLEGEVDSVKLAKAGSLEIAPVGVFKGTARVDEATISGRFEGELTTNGRLTIKDGGAILGSVRYGSIVVESGGSISGDMQVITDSADSADPDTP